jgi:hypothetical protein
MHDPEIAIVQLSICVFKRYFQWGVYEYRNCRAGCAAT